MICALQIGMLVLGIIILVRGRYNISSSKEVTGTTARLMGVVALLPFPMAFGIGFMYGVSVANSGKEIDNSVAIMLDVGITLGGLLVFLVGSFAAAKPKESPLPPAPMYPMQGFPPQPMQGPPPVPMQGPPRFPPDQS